MTGMNGRSWTEFYILITNCPNIATSLANITTSLANITTSFVGMKDVVMLAKDVAMLGRILISQTLGYPVCTNVKFLVPVSFYNLIFFRKRNQHLYTQE